MQPRYEPTASQQPVKGRGHLPGRAWMLPIAVIVLIAGHGAFLHYAASHAALSTAVISGLVVLVAIKHVGLLGPAYAVLRRFLRHDRR